MYATVPECVCGRGAGAEGVGVYEGEGGKIERDRCIEVSRKSQMYDSGRRNIITPIS